jgi:hypothetical protein
VQEKLAAAQAKVESHRQAFLDLVASLAEAAKRSAPSLAKSGLVDEVCGGKAAGLCASVVWPCA